MNKLVLILILATAGAAIGCMHLARELREERQHSATLQARIAELEKKDAERERTATNTPRATPFGPWGVVPHDPEPAATQNKSSPAPNAAAARPAIAERLPQDFRESMRKRFERERELLQDPEYRNTALQQQRLNLLAAYPNLAEDLGMTSEEADRLLDLLAEHQLQNMEHQDARMFTIPGAVSEQEMREAQRLAEQRFQQQQTELQNHLGANYQKWQEYQQTLGQRYRVASVQSALALQGTPLDSAQSRALLNALVAEERRRSSDTAALAYQPPATTPEAIVKQQEEYLAIQERSHERVIQALAADLTSEQLSHLKDLFSREIEMQRTHLKMQRAHGANENRIFIGSGFTYALPAIGAREMAVIEAPESASYED